MGRSTADKVSDDAIRAAIADPDELEPDPAGKGRMRLGRGTLRVVLAHEGAVLMWRLTTGQRLTGLSLYVIGHAAV
jgi:hypothetical protein